MALNVNTSDYGWFMVNDDSHYLKNKLTGKIVAIIKPLISLGRDIWVLENGDLYHGIQEAKIAALNLIIEVSKDSEV